LPLGVVHEHVGLGLEDVDAARRGADGGVPQALIKAPLGGRGLTAVGAALVDALHVDAVRVGQGLNSHALVVEPHVVDDYVEAPL